ncbi:cell division control protein 45, partial [Lecanoromycetidae sp. Uapishka_2]
MYLPRSLISHLYQHLVRTHHSLSPPVLILAALEPDALCACRIFTALLKRDYIAHKIQPIAGYDDLKNAGKNMVQPMRTQEGGTGGTVVCLGVGGMIDMSETLGLDLNQEGEDPSGGVEVWLIDARRPWNLGNVFGGDPALWKMEEMGSNARRKEPEVNNGQISSHYTSRHGGIIVFDDGDIEQEMQSERDSYCELLRMAEADLGEESGESDDESVASDPISGDRTSRKRKSWSDRDVEDDDSDDERSRPRQRQRSNLSDSIPSSPSRPLNVDADRRQSSDDSPGPSSPSQPGNSQPNRETETLEALLDGEESVESAYDRFYETKSADSIPTIVMKHRSYTHMDMDLKRGLRQRLLTYAPMYGLDGLVPPPAGAGLRREGWGFVRSWGWKACLSAVDVGVIIGAILEVGKSGVATGDLNKAFDRGRGEETELIDEHGKAEGEEWVRRFWEAYDALENIEALKHALPTAQHLHRAILRTGTSLIEKRQIRHLRAFRMAVVKEGPDVTLFTHPAALTKLALWIGEAIAEQEREQRGEVGKSGRATPLVLAGLNEARGVYIVVGTGGGGGVIDFAARAKRKAKLEEKAKVLEAKQFEKERKKQEREEREGNDDADEEESEDEQEEESDDDDDDGDEDRGKGRNLFGMAFQEVVDETNARVRIDSFEHCVVEVKKEDLSGFLESLSVKTVVG